MNIVPTTSFPQEIIPSFAKRPSFTNISQCCEGSGHEVCTQTRKNIVESRERKKKDSENSQVGVKSINHRTNISTMPKKKAKGNKSKKTFDMDWVEDNASDADYSNDEVDSSLKSVRNLGKSLDISIGENINN